MSNSEQNQMAKSPKWPIRLWMIMGVVLVIVIGGAYLVYRPKQDKNIPFGRMVISSLRKLYVLDTLGERREIFNVEANTDNEIVGSPSWSPDGKQIVIGARNDIVVMNADGSDIRMLTDDGNSSSPEWSPDGKQIVFTSSIGSDQEIYSMDVDGANLQSLTDNNVRDNSPFWSPDGAQIVFISQQNSSGQDVFVMNANGENVRQLTNDGISKWSPEWSPDGTQIAFYTSLHAGARGRIQIMNADGSGLRTLVGDIDLVGPDLSWSPDGTWLAFGSGFSGQSIIRVDGNGETEYRIGGLLSDWTR